MAIIGGLVGFIVSVLLCSLILFYICRKRRYISYNRLAALERETYDEERCQTVCSCCCCCCMLKRKVCIQSQDEVVNLVEKDRRARSSMLAGVKSEALLTGEASSITGNISDTSTRCASALSSDTSFSIQVSGVMRSHTPVDDHLSGSKSRGRDGALSGRLSNAKIAWRGEDSEEKKARLGTPMIGFETVSDVEQPSREIKLSPLMEKFNIEREDIVGEGSTLLRQPLMISKASPTIHVSHRTTTAGSTFSVENVSGSQPSSVGLPASQHVTGRDGAVPTTRSDREPSTGVVDEPESSSLNLSTSQLLLVRQDSVLVPIEICKQPVDDSGNPQPSTSFPEPHRLSEREDRVPAAGEGNKLVADDVGYSNNPDSNLPHSRPLTAHSYASGVPIGSEPLADNGSLPRSRPPTASDGLVVAEKYPDSEDRNVAELSDPCTSLPVLQPWIANTDRVPELANRESLPNSKIASQVFAPNLVILHSPIANDEPIVTNDGSLMPTGKGKPLCSPANPAVSQPMTPFHEGLLPTRDQSGESPIDQAFARPLSSGKLDVSISQTKHDDRAFTTSMGDFVPVLDDIAGSQDFSTSSRGLGPETTQSKKPGETPNQVDITRNRLEPIAAMPEDGRNHQPFASKVCIEEIAGEPIVPEKVQERVSSAPNFSPSQYDAYRRQVPRKLAGVPVKASDTLGLENSGLFFNVARRPQTEPNVVLPSRRSDADLTDLKGVGSCKAVDKGRNSPISVKLTETSADLEPLNVLGIPGIPHFHHPFTNVMDDGGYKPVNSYRRNTSFGVQEPPGTPLGLEPFSKLDSTGSANLRQLGVYPMNVDGQNMVAKVGENTPAAVREPFRASPRLDKSERLDVPGTSHFHQPYGCPTDVDGRNLIETGRGNTPVAIREPGQMSSHLEPVNKLGVLGPADLRKIPVHPVDGSNHKSLDESGTGTPTVLQESAGTSTELKPFKRFDIAGTSGTRQLDVHPIDVDGKKSVEKRSAFAAREPSGTSPELEPVNWLGFSDTLDPRQISACPVDINGLNSVDMSGRDTPNILEDAAAAPLAMKPDSGSQILTSAEISRRVALKLRRRNRNILPSPVGVITANTDVTLSRTFIESRASDGCSSPTETIPGSIGEPTASAHGFRSRATPDHFKLQTSETMRRMSSLTIPVLDSRDSSRSDSVLSWFSGKISGLFSRSGSRALNTASKASRRSYTMGRTPRAWSMLGTVGKPIEETEEEEQLDSRSDTFSPDITEEWSVLRISVCCCVYWLRQVLLLSILTRFLSVSVFL